jgi:transposase
MSSHGEVDKVGVEGTGTYGAGLARYLRREGVEIVEVDRPDRKTRRLRGKSDPVDAEAAARAALAGTATGIPKTRDGVVEAMRVLEVLYESADKDRTRALNQFSALLLTAPGEIREPLCGLPAPQQLDRARRFHDRDDPDPVVCHTRYVLRELARRVATIDTQQAQLEQRLRPLVAGHAPALVGLTGAGVHTAAALLVTAGDNPQRMRSEAAFANLCASAPIPASSGKTTRHRLNRGGDRRANQALWLACPPWNASSSSTPTSPIERTPTSRLDINRSFIPWRDHADGRARRRRARRSARSSADAGSRPPGAVATRSRRASGPDRGSATAGGRCS